MNQDVLFSFLTKRAHHDGVLPLDLSFKEIMEPWTFQPGYPIVSIERNGSSFTITQVLGTYYMALKMLLR